MRRANKTNSLVLISNHIKSIYNDRWYEDIFHYTGMGQEGDQSLLFAQNKTLNEMERNGVSVYLFEVFEEKEYTYIGQVKLAGAPYTERQLDEKENERNVYVFPLRLVNDQHTPIIDKDIIDSTSKIKEKKAKSLSDEELENRIKGSRKKSGTRVTTTTTYERDPYVVEYTKRRAKGICEFCGNPAPFKNSKGEDYLEVYHVKWLSRGGEDSIENTAALCPNCHRRMHVVDSGEDREKIISNIYLKNI
ncbi:HNH endonuclease [Clostridium sp.]|uniref:HNH endonuclease n=1 Tax=Clostridium sp. TaxID=1506 RepID=UPI00284ACA3C|nr:HNH endonuclease [Clostridium sp.]MDR3598572.1 HNH endonuclease [Clostridium sp.]